MNHASRKKTANFLAGSRANLPYVFRLDISQLDLRSVERLGQVFFSSIPNSRVGVNAGVRLLFRVAPGGPVGLALPKGVDDIERHRRG